MHTIPTQTINVLGLQKLIESSFIMILIVSERYWVRSVPVPTRLFLDYTRDSITYIQYKLMWLHWKF